MNRDFYSTMTQVLPVLLLAGVSQASFIYHVMPCETRKLTDYNSVG